MKYYNFPPLNMEEYQKLNSLNNTKKAAIYSSGHIGRQILKLLQSKGIEVICFINGPQRSQTGYSQNIPICSLSEFSLKTDVEVPIIYCENHECHETTLRDYLIIPWYLLFHDQKMTYSELLKIDPETFCLAQSNHQRFRQSTPISQTQVEFSYINLCVTQKCTLKCTHCNHLIPGFKHAVHYEIEQIKQALHVLFRGVNYIYKIGILGGEPFLHPQLSEIIEFLLSCPQIGCIEILTNGTILPNKKQTQILKNERIFLRISDYGIHSNVLKSSIQYFQENEVLYYVYQDLLWHDYGLSNQSHGKSTSELVSQFQQCSSAQCYHIKGQKLYHCAYSGSIDQQYLKGYPPIPAVELINSKIGKQLSKELIQFKKMPYINICDYCYGDCGTPVIAGIQMT